MLVISRFRTSVMFKSTPFLSLYHVYTTSDEQGVRISNSDFDCQGHSLISSGN